MDKSRYLITEEYTIIQALERLDEVEAKALFVVKNNKLAASVTDGDVRRAILKRISLTSMVKEIANYSPCYVMVGQEKLGFQLLRKNKIQALPIVNDSLEVVGICKSGCSEWKEESEVEILPMAVVIMAGGLGTRLYPYTKILPKALIPIKDTPISERIIQSFLKSGCQQFYMIVNYKKNMIKAYYNDNDNKYNIQFCDEEKPLGTGGGIRLLKDRINSTFVLTNCDTLILDNVKKIVEHHKSNRNIVTMVCSLKKYEIPYGVVNFAEGGELCSCEEKPEISFFVNTGYYILETEVFNYINESENISMPEIIERMKNDKQKIGIYPISESAWQDMGQMDTMERMEKKIYELDNL